MNRTGEYIKSRQNVLSIYFTAGYPNKESTKEVILSLQEAGADMVEVGIPFSDPLADGPIIQKSGEIALQNGFTVQGLFSDLNDIQSQLKIPLVLMGYFNTVYAFGIEAFLSHCQQLNIDTIILPDLPVDIYAEKYRDIFHKYNVTPVFLISPQTSDDRISVIEALSNAFIYVVSDNSITGKSSELSEGQLAYFKRIKGMSFKSPLLLGFGISDRDSFTIACDHFNGAIIGSAFIKMLEASSNLRNSIHTYIASIRPVK